MYEGGQERHKRWVDTAGKERLADYDIISVVAGFEEELSWVSDRAEVDPWDAYLSLMSAVILFNRALAFRLPGLPAVPYIEKRLNDWVAHLQRTVEKVAQGLLSSTFKVSGYSVGVGFPLGISISISFSL